MPRYVHWAPYPSQFMFTSFFNHLLINLWLKLDTCNFEEVEWSDWSQNDWNRIVIKSTRNWWTLNYPPIPNHTKPQILFYESAHRRTLLDVAPNDGEKWFLNPQFLFEWITILTRLLWKFHEKSYCGNSNPSKRINALS